MKVGKLDSRLLEEIVFKHLKYRRPEVMTRAGIGEDCAVVDFGEYECVLSTDPITGAVADIGRLAVQISCNDIASNGVEPLGLLLACMLPEGTTVEEIDEIMRQAGAASKALGVEIIGGHTEITNTVNTPVIVSTAIGKAPKGTSQSAEDMRPGDYILMTKEAGLEGAGIIASDYGDELKNTLSQTEIAEAVAMLDLVSVVKEGVIAGKVGTKGMHDITEGGVLGAVWELCEVSGTGAEVFSDKIPVADVTRKICRHFGIDPFRLISSGSMLIISHPEKKDELMGQISAANIPITCIGRVTDASNGRVLIDGDTSEIIAPPKSDELYKVVSGKPID
ncbi:MAG TPA: AIR synthase family protein [Anaerovoracaceae bacterium]|nr:AIR synthase family protein [Anaerovoracaceae bacterium]